MKPKGSLLHSQETATCPYLDLDQINPVHAPPITHCDDLF